jgi:hypothetical protein
MRHLTMHDKRRSGVAATPATGPYSDRELYCPAAMDSNSNERVELASLIPGGQTHGAGSGRNGSGDTSSPEPAIGYGATKGMNAYYRAVLRFASQTNTD